MKIKGFIVMAFLLVLTLTGCGSNKTNTTDVNDVNDVNDITTLTCTATDESGSSIYLLGFDENDNLKTINVTLEFTDEQIAQNVYDRFNTKEGYNVKIDGMKVVYTRSVEGFKNDFELVEATKTVIKTTFEDEDFICK